MSTPHPDPRLSHKPLRRLHLKPWLWLILIWATLCVAVWAIFAAAALQLFVPTLTLTGSLVRQTTTQDVILPAHMPVAEVLVENDTPVSQGQAVLLYDTEKLDQRMSNLEADLQRLADTHRCLTASAAQTETAGDVPDPASDNGASACEIQQQTDMLERQEQEQRIRQLHLIRQQIEYAGPPLDNVRSRQDQITTQLSYEIERHALQIDIRRQTVLLKKLIADQQHNRQAELHRLTQEQAALQKQRAELQQLLEDPFLRAPQAGMLIRQRPLPRDGTPMTDTAIAQLLTQEAGYQANTTLRDDSAATLTAGDRVMLRLSGLPLTAPKVPARIRLIAMQKGHFDSSPAHKAQLEMLPSDIADPRWRRRIIRHLERMNGQANAELTLQPVPFLTHLQTSALNLWQGRRP